MPTGFRELSAVAECFEDRVGISTTDCGGGRKNKTKQKIQLRDTCSFRPCLSGGLEEEWRRIAGRLGEEEEEKDCRRTRGGLEQHWRRICGGLEEDWRTIGKLEEHWRKDLRRTG